MWHYYLIVGYLSSSKNGNKINGFKILDLKNRFTFDIDLYEASQLDIRGVPDGFLEFISEKDYLKLSNLDNLYLGNKSYYLGTLPIYVPSINLDSRYHKGARVSFNISKATETNGLYVVITMHNANYEFSIVANYIPKIKGYKLNVRGIGNINYYCIDNREVDQKTWDLAKRGINTDDYIEINIKSDIVSEYLTDIGDYTIFNNIYFLNPSKSGDTLVIPNDCKNLYCSRYRLSKFKSVVIPPSLEKFWYYYTINFYNEEDVRGDIRDHKDTKFYFSKNAPASQLYVILRDCIQNYYSNCAYYKCNYEKYENKIETAKTVADLLNVIDVTEHINIELY